MENVVWGSQNVCAWAGTAHGSHLLLLVSISGSFMALIFLPLTFSGFSHPLGQPVLGFPSPVCLPVNVLGS